MLLLRLTAWISLHALCIQLEIAMIMLKQRNEEIVESFFGESNGAIPEAMRLYKIAQTVRVASAATKRFF